MVYYSNLKLNCITYYFITLKTKQFAWVGVSIIFLNKITVIIILPSIIKIRYVLNL